MISSRKIDDLRPAMARLCRAFIAQCRAEGIDVLVYSTYRDHEAQAQIFADGRDSSGRVVNKKKIKTNARPGESWHNWRLAFDFVPMLNGKPQWNDKALYLACGIIAESLGLEWAGRWQGKLRETAHCQYRGGYTLADFQAGRVDLSQFA